MITSGSTTNGAPWRVRRRVWRPLREVAFAFQYVLDHLTDPGRAAALVLVAVVFSGDRDGIEREAVGGGVDLRVDDIAPAEAQAPAMIESSHG